MARKLKIEHFPKNVTAPTSREITDLMGVIERHVPSYAARLLAPMRRVAAGGSIPADDAGQIGEVLSRGASQLSGREGQLGDSLATAALSAAATGKPWRWR